MIFLGPKIIKGSPEKLLSYYFIEFFNFLHWPKSGPDKFIILESLLIYRVLIQRVSTVVRYYYNIIVTTLLDIHGYHENVLYHEK
jgi:hypothetical protein